MSREVEESSINEVCCEEGSRRKPFDDVLHETEVGNGIVASPQSQAGMVTMMMILRNCGYN